MKNGIPAIGYNHKQVELYNNLGGLKGLRDVIEYSKTNIKNHTAKKFGISFCGLTSILKDPEEKMRIFKLIERGL